MVECDMNWQALKPQAVWPLVTLTLVDRVVTLEHFGYESNPLVLALGPWNWFALTLALVVGMVAVWYYFGVWRSSLAVAITALVTAVTALVVVLNTIVLI